MITKDIEKIIKKNVLEVVAKIFSDPDLGLKYKKSFVKRIKKSLEDIKKKRTYSFDEVLKMIK